MIALPTDEKKGITVKVDAGLHAEVRAYIESHGMTMAEFVTLALTDELHPKFHEKEEKYMGNMRTVAFQVPEDLFQKVKEYLQRNNMTQKEFLIGLIEDELERDMAELESVNEAEEDFAERDEEYAEQEKDGWVAKAPASRSHRTAMPIVKAFSAVLRSLLQGGLLTAVFPKRMGCSGEFPLSAKTSEIFVKHLLIFCR